MKIILWTSIILIIYPYGIYPLTVLLVGLLHPRRVKRASQFPTLAILIPAYNEAACIGTTIQNKLDQGYPRSKLQIIVISDGSTDDTDDVAKRFADRGVTLLRREARQGKAAAINDAVRLARGDIIVFCDANTIFGPKALHRIAENFADPEVGYVTGYLGFIANDFNVSSAGVGAYMRYENLVRKIETAAGSIIGVNGGVDAIRRDLYVVIPPHLITDFILPLTVIAGKHRVIYDPLITAFEAPNTEVASEFKMRVRVALRALQGMAYMWRLFNPFRHPLASFCLFSHKLLRYMGFIFMFSAIVSNAFLAHGNEFYQVLLALQFCAYGVALLGLTQELPKWLKKICLVPSYLLLSNAAFAIASFRFFRGDTMAVWRPRAG